MEQTFAVTESSVRSLISRVAPNDRVITSPSSALSPVGEGGVDAEEHLVRGGVVDGVVHYVGRAAVVG